MIKCDIAGIKIGLKYNYDDCFKNNIESYIKEDIEIDHIIEVNYKETLNDIKYTKILSKKGDDIKSLLQYDKDYKRVNIFIKKDYFLEKDLPTIEYIYMGMMFLEISHLYEFFPVHGSAIELNRDVLIFCAPSGTGKSTHTNLWRKEYPIKYINDDKPLLKIENNDIYVYGSPFSGEYRKNINTKQKLKAIIFLSRGSKSEILELSNDEKIKKILKNSLRPEKEDHWNHTLKLINEIIDKKLIFQANVTMDKTAVDAVFNKIYKNE